MAPQLSGWLWNGERLVVDDRAEGAFARGMAVLGGCRLHPECTRRVALDWRELVDQGFAKTPLDEVRRRYECQRHPRCGMAWIETYPAGVPLQAYVGGSSWLVVTCKGCGAAQAFTFERMIEALVQAGRGSGNTSVLRIAAALRRPCRTCRASNWSVVIEQEQGSGSGPPRKKLRPAGATATRAQGDLTA